MTGLALDTKKTIFRPTTFEVVIELAPHVSRQGPALGGLQIEKWWLILFDPPVQQGLIRTMTPIAPRLSRIGLPGRS